MDQDVTSQFDRMQNAGAYPRPGLVKGNIRCSHILWREMEPFHPMIKVGLPQGRDLICGQLIIGHQGDHRRWIELTFYRFQIHLLQRGARRGPLPRSGDGVDAPNAILFL